MASQDPELRKSQPSYIINKYSSFSQHLHFLHDDWISKKETSADLVANKIQKEIKDDHHIFKYSDDDDSGGPYSNNSQLYNVTDFFTKFPYNFIFDL